MRFTYMHRDVRNYRFKFYPKLNNISFYSKIANIRDLRALKLVGYANTCVINKGWIFYSFSNLGYVFPNTILASGLGYRITQCRSMYIHYYSIDQLKKLNYFLIDLF